MDWIALVSLLIATITGILGTVKDFRFPKHGPPFPALIRANRVPFATVLLCCVAFVVGIMAIRQTKGESESLRSDNEALQRMIAGLKQSKPTIRLFIRSRWAHHRLPALMEEFDKARDSATPFQKRNTIGLLGSSVRNVIFYAPSSGPTSTGKVGEILPVIDRMQNSLEVYGNGLVIQIPGPGMQIEKPEEPFLIAQPGDLGDDSDAFVAELPLASEWKWDSLMGAVSEAAERKSTVLEIVEYNVTSCPTSLPKFSEATLSYELQRNPRFALLLHLEPKNLKCSGHQLIYDLAPRETPRILTSESGK